MPFSPWETDSTTVCLTIAGPQVLDVYGNNFPAQQACTTLDHRFNSLPLVELVQHMHEHFKPHCIPESKGTQDFLSWLSYLAFCRPVGILYAPYMAFSGSQGAVTNDQNVALLAVFSEAVTGLSTSNFKACPSLQMFVLPEVMCHLWCYALWLQSQQNLHKLVWPRRISSFYRSQALAQHP